jgi:hypothetical protein
MKSRSLPFPKFCGLRRSRSDAAGSWQPMNRPRYTRRDFPLRLAAILPLFGIAESAFSLAAHTDRSGISNACECIHQEVAFKVPRKRVMRP